MCDTLTRISSGGMDSVLMHALMGKKDYVDHVHRLCMTLEVCPLGIPV